jgi:hypothetical protein
MQALQVHSCFQGPAYHIASSYCYCCQVYLTQHLIDFLVGFFLHCSSLSCSIQILYEFQWTDQHGCEVNPQEDIKIVQISGSIFIFFK